LAEIPIPAKDGAIKRLGELRDRASLQWSATCLSKLDPEVLTPIIEGRWLDGYDSAKIYPRVRCPVLLLQADPLAGGALTDNDAQAALRSIAHCHLHKFPGISHQIHCTQPEAMLLAVQDFAAKLRGTLSTPFPS
jgi:pimeloyl-ACP methyl ester carboxylesterase